MTVLRRSDLRGSSKTNEHIKLICDIRHQHTNYEKLVVFYNMYPDKRSELNREISKLIKEGPEGIIEFRENVKQIEDWVNLNIKKSQKRFIDEEINRLQEYHPHYSKSKLKNIAQDKLAMYIRRNNESRQGA